MIRMSREAETCTAATRMGLAPSPESVSGSHPGCTLETCEAERTRLHQTLRTVCTSNSYEKDGYRD